MSVLVGWSGSDEGAEALVAGAAEARLRSVELAVVDLSPTDDRGEAARRALAGLAEQPPSAQVLDRPQKQDAVEALLDAARSTGAQLVVIGTRRRSPVGKFLLGSAAQRIILDADVPVLVVKAGRSA